MKPAISVIITSFNEEKNIRDCLASLAAQKEAPPFEIIVVDSGTDRTAEIAADEFPHVRLIKRDERTFCGEARNLGIRKARADIVAFLDADCTASSDWVRRIVTSFEAFGPVLGGCIANDAAASRTSWAAYFCEFSRYMPGTSPGTLKIMSGANVSFRKDLFKKHGPFITDTYSSDTVYHHRLARNGIQGWYDPSIVVTHKSISGFKTFLAHEFDHGRAFGAVRVRYLPFSRFRRSIYPFLSILIVLKLFAETAIRVYRSKRYQNHYLRAVPFLIMGLTAWCLGESAAYLGVKRNE